ncbi:MAG: hypothetical protein GEV11_04850 [Streptosporangiales bacterium]|nr:hypothetical protein [Streptosporangiales bacterium]
MLRILRSRKTLIILVGVIALGLVIPFLANFIAADNAGTPVTGESARPAPPVAAIGQPPQDITYADLGQSCQTGECFRVVGVTAPADTDAAGALKDVHEHLGGQGFQQLAAIQDNGEFTVTGGGVVVQSGAQSPNPEAVATLVIAWAQPGGRS